MSLTGTGTGLGTSINGNLTNRTSNGGGYTIEHIFNDCINDKSRLDTTRGRNNRGKLYYEECWNALNNWIETRLKKRLGATVSPLGDFTWEIKNDESSNSNSNSNNNERLCRPIFLVSETFIKNHHIKQKYFHQPNDIAKCEEVNYSNLAIKFSKTLTKDMIFSGIRDIIKKIGDYIDRIYEIEIAFSFGVLYSKERRIRFEFDTNRLVQILPESMTQSVSNKSLGYDNVNNNSINNFDTFNDNFDDLMISTVRTTTGNGPSSSSAASAALSTSSINNSNLALPTLSSSSSYQNQNDTNRLTSRPATTQSSSRLNITHSAPSLLSTTAANNLQQQQQHQQSNDKKIPNLNLTYKTIDRSVPPQPLSPGFRSLLESMDEKTLSRSAKIERRIKCCDDVAKQAFKRCLHNVENNAIDDDYIEFQRKLLHKEWQDKEKDKKERFKKELCDIQDTLRSQMNEVNDRKQQEIDDRKHGKITFGLPGQIQHVEPSNDEIRRQKQEMLNGLQKQIETTNNLIKLKKNEALAEENKRLQVLKNDLELDRLQMKANHLEKQRDLLEAWERDAHVKNLQKLTNKGSEAVKVYMKSTGLINHHESSVCDGDESLPSTRGTFRLNNVGIGFDTRRNKLGL